MLPTHFGRGEAKEAPFITTDDQLSVAGEIDFPPFVFSGLNDE
jgi:hypothetical protein